MIKEITMEMTWPIRHEVMWPDKDMEYSKLVEDPRGIHYGYFVNDELVSIITLFIYEEFAQFRKFATKVPFQGKGYGSKLLRHTIDKAKEKNIKRLICNARREKVDFYRLFGMHKTEECFSKEGREYVVMAIEFEGQQQ